MLVNGLSNFIFHHCAWTLYVLLAGMVLLTVWLISGHRGAGGADHGPGTARAGHQVKPNNLNMLKKQNGN